MHPDHRWDVCRHVAAAMKYSEIRSYDEEYARQLDILVEELNRWLGNETTKGK